jgi:hypothetical protein
MGARLVLLRSGAARPLAAGFAATADAALSFDARSILFAGKEGASDPWRIYELPLAGGAPRRVSGGEEDCIRPLYLPRGRIVYARRSAGGFHLELAGLDGNAPERLTFGPGNRIPAAVLRDGRILFESAEGIFTIYSDGSGVEAYRCDHGPERHSSSQLASGDVIFQSGARFGRFTSARAAALDVAVPPGDYVGPMAELSPTSWLAHCRAPQGLCRFTPDSAATPTMVAPGGAFQPVVISPRPVPPAHPSSLGNREGANLLCLDAYASRDGRIDARAIARVRVWSRAETGAAVVLGDAPVEPDGSFYVQTPADRPLRFELLDHAGRSLLAQRGWFWARRGEQRVCVGCHPGPERAPANVAPQVLLRTQDPVRLTGGR